MNRIGYFIPPPLLVRDYPSHVQYSGENRLLSPPECDALIEHGETQGFFAAQVGSPGNARLDERYRKVGTTSAGFGPEFQWLYERITQRVEAANRDYWDFDITGLLEPFQILRYEAAETADAIAGHYDWHQDFGAGFMGRRKLSLVVQLSDPADYDGCRLTIMHHRQEQLPYTGRGEGVIFPSWTPHFVAPITRGVRYALVAWIHGAPFR